MGGAIRDALRDLFGDDGDTVPVLYGGSVNAGNAEAFAGQPSINGALVGGASLQADQFLQIASAVAPRPRDSASALLDGQRPSPLF